MCGIAGFITAEKGKGSFDRKHFMEQALMLNTLRGADSAGVFYVPIKDPSQAGWYKQMGNGFDFVSSEKYTSIEKDMHEYLCMVSHNRSATVGKCTIENAHPFQEGPITLVHNGTLDSVYMLPEGSMWEANKDRKEEDKIEVDSHLIAVNLAAHGIDKVVGAIRGAFALVWHDKRTSNIYAIRNDRRPLCFAADKESKSVLFMSEPEMLYSLCARNKIKIGKLYQPEPGVLLTFTAGNIRPSSRKVPLNVDQPGKASSFGFSPSGGTGSRAPFVESSRNRKTGGRRGGRDNTTRTPSIYDDNSVFVGGKSRAVPMVAQDMLLEKNLVVEDRMLMTPITFIPYKGDEKTGSVIGESFTKEAGAVTCLIHGVEASQWLTFKRNRWAVRPIAITHQDSKNFLVLSKVVTMREDSARTVIAAQSPPSLSLVPGPAHTRITLDRFKELTKDGCFECNEAINAADCSDIVWLSNDKPLCQTCVIEYAHLGAAGMTHVRESDMEEVRRDH